MLITPVDDLDHGDGDGRDDHDDGDGGDAPAIPDPASSEPARAPGTQA